MKNVGVIDRAIRVIVGMGVLLLYFVLEGPQRWISLIGLLLMFSGGVDFVLFM